MPAFPAQSFVAALIAQPMRTGEIIWLGIRPERRKPPLIVERVNMIAATGIEGDRYRTTHNGSRQVTLIAEEDINAIAAFLGRTAIDPALLRRNVVTRGINLNALKRERFRLGSAVLEGSGDCAPCSHMEEALGQGGYNAMRGRGGITARILTSGNAAITDKIEKQPI